jgi:hypothetical protein
MLTSVEVDTPDGETQDIPTQNWIDLAKARPCIHLEEQALALRQGAAGTTEY